MRRKQNREQTAEHARLMLYLSILESSASRLLPTQGKLAKQIGVSPGFVNKNLKQLTGEGKLFTYGEKRNRRYYMTPKEVDSILNAVPENNEFEECLILPEVVRNANKGSANLFPEMAREMMPNADEKLVRKLAREFREMFEAEQRKREETDAVFDSERMFYP